jgi:L-asparaginase II
MLTRDAILAAADLSVQAVAVPEWGGSVHIRVMNGGERGEFEAAAVATKKDDAAGIARLRVLMVALTLCDAGGTRLFTSSPEDLALLNGKSGEALDRVARAAMTLNQAGADGLEAAQGK